uniref:Uncharacterized protein n=1 Tax=Rhizophagus irregularis (strain DAOM 181602 / DAOM 197198 / MUCL 43194) TaxID=747089 RepID=U9U5Y7_RHIID
MLEMLVRILNFVGFVPNLNHTEPDSVKAESYYCLSTSALPQKNWQLFLELKFHHMFHISVKFRGKK